MNLEREINALLRRVKELEKRADDQAADRVSSLEMRVEKLEEPIVIDQFLPRKRGIHE